MPRRRLEEAVSLLSEEANDQRARFLMHLTLAALLLDHGLELTPRGLEGAEHDGAQVVVHVTIAWLAGHDDGPWGPADTARRTRYVLP